MAVITYLTRILFDFGTIAKLGEELAAIGVKRPMIVTDKGVAAAGLADRAVAAIGNHAHAAATYDGTPGNPTEAAVMEALALYREAGCDGLVAVGGGSSMDLAKAVALLATHDGALTGFMAVEGGVAKITAKVAPVIAIPTTSGTGSEVGRGAVIVLGDGRKLTLLSPHLIPRVALCDPEMTLGLPAKITAATGMDAMAHCIETYISNVVNPPAEGIAIEGLRRCAGNIEKAVADGSDRQARWEMMMASMMGAMAFQKGLGAIHAMSHPLGALPLGLHHGTLNAVVAPAVLRFNAGHVGARYERIRDAMGLAPDADLPQAIADLNARIGLPGSLREMGVTERTLNGLETLAEKDHTNLTNPRPAKAADYVKLFHEALR